MPVKQIKKLKIGQVHRCYSLPLPEGGDALLFVVAQAFVSPCLWSAVYLVLPREPEPLVMHCRFDPKAIDTYLMLTPTARLDWLTGDYMSDLALSRVLRHVYFRSPSSLNQPMRLGDQDLLNRRLEGRFPQLKRLLEICAQHYLLHQQLIALSRSPVLDVQEMPQIPSRP